MGDKPLLKPTGKWIIALTIVAALAASGLGFFVFAMLRSEDSPSKATASPEPAIRQSEKAVTALGRLEPAGGIFKIAAPSTFGSARVSRLLVKEGSQIKAGQVIAIMDDGERLLASVAQAEAQVREAQSRLAQVRVGAKQGDIEAQKATVERLQAEQTNALSEYQRYADLYRNGAVSASELDRRRLAVDTASKALEQARKTLSSIAEVRPTDIRQAEAQVAVTIAALNRAKADFNNSLIRAPIGGQILKIHAEPGEVVGSDGIAELGNTEQMYAVAEVYETDVSRVRVGQPATVTSSAFPAPITGVVDNIGLQIRKNDVLNTDPTADTDTRVVEVKVRLNDSRSVAGLTNLKVEVVIQP